LILDHSSNPAVARGTARAGAGTFHNAADRRRLNGVGGRFDFRAGNLQAMADDGVGSWFEQCRHSRILGQTESHAINAVIETQSQ
jgi:hypothetical protein